MISREDIERRRTPAELCEFVATTRAQVEANHPELKVARKRTGLYKMFVDEVMPLALAAQHICAPDDRLLPVHGNQGYDAVVFDASGREKEKIEIAKPYDGKANADDVKLIEQRGYGAIKIRNMGEGLAEIAALVIATARAKALKDYSDCTILIAALIDPPFDAELPEVQKAAELLCDDLKAFRYTARRVVLVVPPLQQCFVVQG